MTITINYKRYSDSYRFESKKTGLLSETEKRCVCT